jgi:hypothetical protein
MSVTGSSLAERTFNLKQIERLVGSPILHGSESLCKLLRYLAEQSLENPGTPIREYQIATQVFGRQTDFDPRVDSTVRVQTGRLRSKLAEYYSGPGADDPIVVEIPKGSYSLSFHARHSATPSMEGIAGAAPAERPAVAHTGQVATPKAWRIVTLALALALIAALVVIAFLLVARRAASVSAAAADAPPVFRRFWKSFIDQPDQPWVVFSNAEFVGRPETGMKYFNPPTDSRERILDHYTGVGEVLAIHELDRVFDQLHHGLRVKRGRLLSLDDARNNDLIFIGSPSENLTLREIPSTQDFLFRKTDLPTRKGDLGILNVRPQPGEQPVYLASPGMPLTEDYALVALVSGMSPSHAVMILAGTTTIGTQAAVEYVCRAGNLEDLIARLTGSSAGEVPPFEAVLRVRISSGVPVHSELAALHRGNPSRL